jgi:hypothetical protein
LEFLYFRSDVLGFLCMVVNFIAPAEATRVAGGAGEGVAVAMRRGT